MQDSSLPSVDANRIEAGVCPCMDVGTKLIFVTLRPQGANSMLIHIEDTAGSSLGEIVLIAQDTLVVSNVVNGCRG